MYQHGMFVHVELVLASLLLHDCSWRPVQPFSFTIPTKSKDQNSGRIVCR